MSDIVKVRAIVPVPLKSGMADFVTFDGLSDPKHHIAIAYGNWKEQETPLVRIHSECLTGDVFESEKCDCGDQLDEARARCRDENGIILYLRQEGRGIGLYNKLDAYVLQNEGADTYAANRLIHQPEDGRSFEVAAEMLKALDIAKVHLLTNNPKKAKQLNQFGVETAKIIPTKVYLKKHNVEYLKAKRDQYNHQLIISDEEAS